MTSDSAGIRAGEITAIYPERGTARVYFPDLDLVTDESPILIPAAVKSRDYRMPEIGETVLVAFLDTAEESTVVLGSMYTEKDPVPVASADIRHWSMEGAGAIEFNRKTGSVLIVDAAGSAIKMSGGDIILQAKNNIELNPGTIEIPEHLNAIFN